MFSADLRPMWDAIIAIVGIANIAVIVWFATVRSKTKQ